jgi:hypothetical protein
MTEKSFAAPPYSCHEEILDVPVSMHLSIENFTMASDKIMAGSKDFEGIHDSAFKEQFHFLTSQ